MYINHNLPASGVANTLIGHYGSLQKSTQRLSTGLRINGAADDAAGLAIRELMRADIAALNQGARNANDAISMLQVFDGALGVIDEKLIRMKELAEQAATGTYDSVQRLMIDSEFQAMGSEIDRIANATDFNGVKLLTAKMMTWYEDVTKFRIDNPGSIDNLNPPTGIHAALNINPNNYINENNPTKKITVSLTATSRSVTYNGAMTAGTPTPTPGGISTPYTLGDSKYTVAYVNAAGNPNGPVFDYDGTNWTITDQNGDYRGIDHTGDEFTGSRTSPLALVVLQLKDKNGNNVDFDHIDDTGITSFNIDTFNNTYSITRNIVEINDQTAEYTASYNEDTQTVTVRFTNGGTATMRLDNALQAGDTISFEVNMEGEVRTEPEERHGVDPDQRVKIHFGTENDSAEDYYYIKYANCTLEGLGLADTRIHTQNGAQEALVQINDAIVAKDKVRSDFGAMQNRLENTVTNLRVQSENLQASESRISDTDVAIEMMNFVRQQILTQSAVAMLSQANSMPQMVMSLIG